jgi:hypothetical protein
MRVPQWAGPAHEKATLRHKSYPPALPIHGDETGVVHTPLRLNQGLVLLNAELLERLLALNHQRAASSQE